MSKTNSKALSIQVNLNGLSFCILNKTSNTIELLRTVSFNHKLLPTEVLSNLKAELSSNAQFSDDFDNVLVIHQNELASLVPESLYDQNYKADYLKFNSKILRTDFITEDTLETNKSINVYVPYVNINNYIFDTFGEFVFKHASTILIDTFLQRKEASDGPDVLINVNSSSIDVVVADKGQLLLFNVFEYHSKEDFIYYILFVFEQLQLDTETTIVQLSGTIIKDDELYNILYTYVRHVDFVNWKVSYEFSNHRISESIHKNYLILNSF